ncbi:M28 family peptidase [Glaciihabitans tibetensis]|uniref:M28 family peptidase n=1 Tax=Glaciihabitans tibetensis TaxID=1266600 RepID=UPI0011B2416B|nr:M28 family peptidase [Glaciihabitans tibetensis]
MAQSITGEAVMRHLEQFQAIADAHGGSRALGTPGYALTAQYIEQQLQGAGYTTKRDEFEVVSQEILKYAVTVDGITSAPAMGVPFGATVGTGPDGVDGTIVRPVDLAGEGCRASDWAGVDAVGEIALVTLGACSFLEKSMAAATAGADALIVANTADVGLAGEFSEQDALTIPTIGVSGTQAAALTATAGTVLGITIVERTTRIPTFNVLAETSTGHRTNTVMAGAHLDSVPAGAGINDNGSGSAALLETALVLAKSGELNNQMRFAWWGAEEVGLVGSINYVGELLQNDPSELEHMVGYLNFDMVGSPNHIMGVYDANQSSYAAPLVVPPGSLRIEKLFTDYFDSIGQPWVDTPFDGRSDYFGFLLTGVPSGGLFTGADGIKTPAEAALFGGTAGLPHDPNYHTAGDRLANVDPAVLDVAARAIGFVTTTLAIDDPAIDGSATDGSAIAGPAIVGPVANGPAVNGPAINGVAPGN